MFKFDLHIHSQYSRDSKAPLEDILRTAKEKGLDGIAICDHDEIEGAYKAMALVREFPEKYGGLVVIPGIEVSTAKGHILALNVSEKIPPMMTPEETTDYARDLGALSIIAHPFRKSAHGIGYVEGAGADAVETFNSKSTTNGANQKADQEADRLKMPKTGGSDAHIAELVGRGYTNIDATENTTEAVLEAIRQGKTIPGGELTPYSVVVRQMGGNVIRRTKRFFKMQFHEV
ncbi:hypothetical protein MsAg5_16750 [Methanosarcinaceae archaeon Ag5]|uniref:Polymerase/histidinol phosphatase N-terminal domain-containing protein n=1 Tax=Methanolapillus africanus TaxID=3028297 RepID=A0AAE4SDN5_9EURY|nr:hypothetical protein [Methanosarcinaceae archaeon Ag5]